MRILCIALAFALLAPLARAQSFDRLLPENTIIYMSLDNIPKSKARYKDSSLFALWNDAAVQAFLEKPLQKWAGMMESMKKESGVTAEEVLALFGGQFAVAIVEMKMGRRGENTTVRPVLLADIGENERRVRELMAKSEENDDRRRVEEEFRGTTIVQYLSAEEEDEAAKKDSGPNCWFLNGRTMAMAENTDDLKKMLVQQADAEAPSLATNDAFRRVRARLGEGDAFVYCNVRALIQSLAGAENPEMQMGLAAVGLGSVDGVGMSAGLSRAGLSFRTFLSIPGEKRGVFKLFDSRNAPLTPPRWVPPDASSVTTMAIDFSALIAEAKRIAAEIGQPGAVEMGLEMAKGMGVDIENDIIGSLGKELTMFTKLPQEGTLVAPTAVAIAVKDKPKLDTAINTLLQVAQNWGLQTQDEEYMGVKLRTVSVFFFKLGFTLLPDQLLISTDMDMMKGVVRSHGKDVKGLVDSEAFAAAVGNMPQGRIAVDFSHFAKTFRQGMVSTLLQTGFRDLDMNLFPSTDVIEKYIGAGAGAMVNEEGGLFYTHMIAFKPKADADK